MKTKEFNDLMKSFGCTVKTRADRVEVFGPFGDERGSIALDLQDAYYVSNFGVPVAKVIAEYAATPLVERKDEKRWNVIVGQDINNAGLISAWCKKYNDYAEGSYIDDDTTPENLKNEYYIFTNSEFDYLITHLKSLDNGDVYAKIAELGKREVKE
ncbi:hypothetical protein [Levilactobacillus enshiensis]|uniref:hypothetical protein n=1 Tax=Levilactobacillus enshiensis TaxID=2590213 RepID=UPI00117BB817|nr:hypothetical protein [Levilactobacillus enshiensis]